MERTLEHLCSRMKIEDNKICAQIIASKNDSAITAIHSS
jgi:hypothetical protein